MDRTWKKACGVLAGLAVLFGVGNFEIRINSAAAQGSLTPEKVIQAIRRGRQYLKSKQSDDGSWRLIVQHRVGVTSLAVLSLINSGLTPKDAAVRKGLSYLRRQRLPDTTYDASLLLMAFAAAKDNGDKSKIISLAVKLERGQLKSGSWTYSLSGGGFGDGDRSNCQFAVLGLRDAVLAGVKVKRETWQRVRNHWINERAFDGSWGYSGRGHSGTGSMTVAGVATMAITSRMLQDDKGLNCCAERKPDPYVAAASRWLGRYFSVTTNPGRNGSSNLLYYLYGLERAGRLSGRRFFAKHDWYREGASFFVRPNYQHHTGYWIGRGIGESNPVIGTCMALLFLSKGLAPVLINKLEYGPADRAHPDEVAGYEWNRHPYDFRNLTDRITQLPRWPKLLTWQTVSMNKLIRHGGAEEALDQSKVLLITGHKSPDTLLKDPKQIKILKQYIDRGGFIFAVGNCNNNGGFDAGFRKLVDKIFAGDARLKRLAPGHPIFRAEYSLSKEAEAIELYGVSYGCRTAVVYAPVGGNGFDIACLWDKWSPQASVNNSRPFNVRRQVGLAMKIGVNVIAYATGREPRQKLQQHIARKEKGRNDRVTRGFLQVAKIKTNGDWDVAPKALRNLLMGLNAVAGMTASTKQHNLYLNDPNLFKYPMVYLHGRSSFKVSQMEVKALKTYLKERGGLLFADACCGSAKFDASFRELMLDLFPNEKFKRIPVTHEMFTRKIGFDIKKVRRNSPESNNKNVPLNQRTKLVEPYLEGIEIKGRFVVIYSKFDISCALERQSSIACAGYIEKDAMRIAVNVLMYAMLQDIRYSSGSSKTSR